MLKVFRICPLHTNSEAFRVQHDLDRKTFSEQIKLLREEGIIIPGGWASATEAEGYEVFETIYNDTSLQTQWCKEKNPYLLSSLAPGADIHFEILKQQVLAFEPDIIFIFAHALILVPQALRAEICALSSKKILLTGYWGDELPSEYYRDFRDLDFVFCSSSVYEQRFVELTGIPALTIGNSFDDAIAYKKPVEKVYDFIFCGRTGYRLAQHVTRYNWLVEIAKNTKLQIWGYEWPELTRQSDTTRRMSLICLSLAPAFMLKSAVRLIAAMQNIFGDKKLLLRGKQLFELALEGKKTLKRDILALLVRLPTVVLRMLSIQLWILQTFAGADGTIGRAKRAAAFVLQEKAARETKRQAVENLSPTDEYWQGEYWYDKKPLEKLFPERYNPLLTSGSDYYTLLAESKLVLNLHRIEDADIGNVRCYEVTGLGSCLVTDRGSELKEFFDVDNDLVAFETPEECIQKVNYLLANPSEIERISKNGQRATLSRHTAKHRAITIANKHRELFAAKPAKQSVMVRTDTVVHAIYDTDKNPISYDIAFFLQAAEIFRKTVGAADLIVSIVWPKDIAQIPGIPRSYNLAVDADAKEFRLFHIAVQMSALVTSSMVLQIKDRTYLDSPIEFLRNKKVITYPHPDRTHHAQYYRLVNENPSLMEGFSASQAAHRYVDEWLRSLAGSKKLLCITLRQYAYDTQRNSDLAAWAEFLNRVDSNEFLIVIVPDTDHFADGDVLFSGKHPIFTPACFDVDLRFALYEKAYLNMFVNNGPGSAATLSRKIRYLMFKLVVPGIVHCSEEILSELGFKPGESPSYASGFQKWVWTDDDVENLWKEFSAMKLKIDAGGESVR